MPRNALLINILATLGFSFITYYYTPEITDGIFVIIFSVITYVVIVLFYLCSNIKEKNSHIIVLSLFLNFLLISSCFYFSFAKHKENSIAEIINNQLLITIMFFQDLCKINYAVLILVLSTIFFSKLKFFSIANFLQKVKNNNKNKIIAYIFTFISAILAIGKILYKLLIMVFFIAGLFLIKSLTESNYHFLYILIISLYLYYYFKNITKDKYIIIKLIFAIVATNIIFLPWSKNFYIDDQKTTISDQKTKIMNNKHIIIPIRTEDIRGLDAEPFMYLKATDPTEDALLKKAFEKSLIKHNIQHRFTVITPSEIIPSGRFKPVCSLYYLEKEKDTTTVLIFIDKKWPDITFDIVNPLANSVYNLRYFNNAYRDLPPIDEISDLSIEWLGYIYKKYSDNIYNDVNQKFSTRILEFDNNYRRKFCQWSYSDEYYFETNL